MRQTPTLGERELWRFLRDRKVDGSKFRRQAPVGPYIADFVCFARRLVIEVDGYFHSLNSERDAARDRWFRAENYRVLRLPDRLILNAPEEALRLIRTALAPPGERSATPHPTPSGGHLLPQEGEGNFERHARHE